MIFLFTIIALMLSIFGATYSAISALRNHLELRIRENVKEAEKMFKGIEHLKGTGSSTITDNIAKYYKRLVKAYKWWNTFHFFPILIFCITTLGLTIFILTQPIDSDYKQYWCFFKWVVGIILAIDLFCILAAYLNFRSFEGSFENFKDQMTALNTTEARSSIGKPTVVATPTPS